MKKIAIFGYSGFASEIADICDAVNYAEVVYLSEGVMEHSELNGIKIIEEHCVLELAASGFEFAIGVSSPVIRKSIYQKFKQLNFPNLIHPSATFGRGQIELISKSKGLVVAAGARFMSGINVGDFVVVSLNSTIGHDCHIGSYASIMPGANISGNVFIDEEVFVGSGAVVLQGLANQKLHICKSLTVGAGSVVTKSFFDGVIVVGVPARIMK